ncbi:MAG: hypothetical protein ACK4UZ_13595, partial [Rhizobium rhizophilum]
THVDEPAADAAHAAAPEHGAEQVAHTEERPTVVDEAAAHSPDGSSHDGAVEQAAGHDAAAVETLVAEEAPAEGEGWFSSLKSVVGLGGSQDEAPATDVAAEAKPAEGSDGAKSADHGAAWLEKMRAQPIAPEGAGAAVAPTKTEEHGAATDAHPPAEDEAILPPKAKAKGDEHAKADH